MKYDIKETLIGLMLFVLIPLASSCNHQESEPDVFSDDTPVSLNLGNIVKPAYVEEINLTGSRNVPGFDKDDEWKEGDKLLLKISIDGNLFGPIYETLTYTDGNFSGGSEYITISNEGNLILNLPVEKVKEIKLAASKTYSLEIDAYYANAYEWDNGQLSLMNNLNFTAPYATGSGKTTLENDCSLSENLTIALEHQTARLRVYLEQPSNVKFDASADFMPSGASNDIDYEEMANPNADFTNAYFYGTSDEARNGLNISVGGQNVYVASNYRPVTLEAGKAYVIEADFYLTEANE